MASELPLTEAFALRGKIVLLRELKNFLDEEAGNSSGKRGEWIRGHEAAIRSVENWLVEKILDLGHGPEVRDGSQ